MEESKMTARLNELALKHAEELIHERGCVDDDCALLAAESRAGQYKDFDIERAAHELHMLIRPSAHPLANERKRRHEPVSRPRQASGGIDRDQT
jgi:hypothetical protein